MNSYQRRKDLRAFNRIWKYRVPVRSEHRQDEIINSWLAQHVNNNDWKYERKLSQNVTRPTIWNVHTTILFRKSEHAMLASLTWRK